MRIVLYLFLISVAVSACTSLKDPELKPAYPEKWRNASSASSPETNNAWWLALNDDVLNETIAIAQKQNLSIAQASERLIAARNIGASIIAGQRPQIGFTAGPDNLARAIPASSGGTTDTSNFRTRGAYLAGFDLNWELPFFGRGESERKIAQSDINLANAGMQAISVSTIAEVVRTYGNLRAAQEKHQLLSKQLENIQTLESLHAGAADAGLVSRNEYESYRSTVAETKHALLNAYTQQEIALQRLSVLCGLTQPLDHWLEQPTLAQPIMAQNSADHTSWQKLSQAEINPNLPAELIRQRPDIMQAEANVMNAAGQAGVAHADIYPKLSIEGALQVAGSISNARPTRVITVLAPAMRLPVVDWGLARDVANARDAKLREAILSYREAVLLAVEETETALANYHAAQEHFKITQGETEHWSTETARSQSAFSAGYIARVDLLKAQTKMVEQNLQEVESKLEWLTAFAVVNKVQAKMRDDFYQQALNKQDKQTSYRQSDAK
jgi:outer membrane protein TolC